MGSAGEVDAYSVTQKSDLPFAVLASRAQAYYGDLFNGDDNGFPAMGDAAEPSQLYYGLCKARNVLEGSRAAAQAERLRQTQLGHKSEPSPKEDRFTNRIALLTEFINHNLAVL